jgi:AraC family transcriptional regulator, alkane utilization regulator
MTETPEVLPQTPRGTDLLSDLLGTVRLSGAVLFHAELGEPWAVAVPDASQLAQALPFRTEHIIPFHVIARGSCWLDVKGQRTWLASGQAILMPYGDGHCLGGKERATIVPLSAVLPPPPWYDAQFLRFGGTGATTQVICGFVHCEELLFNPFLRGLPALLYANPAGGAAAQWLETTIGFTAEEARGAHSGARSILPRLTELMFVEVLRSHLQALPAGQVGWLAALNDPVVGPALKCLHSAPREEWTVTRLARLCGVSRTVLAERFTQLLEQPPMQYLTRWRLQIAAQLLKTADKPVKAIAAQAGYESEFAFSRAFKRIFGLPPADWRRHQTAGAP